MKTKVCGTISGTAAVVRAALAIGMTLHAMFAESRASIGFYVGKNLTQDGSVILAGYGDEPSSHWLTIAPRREHAAGSTITVGATEEAWFPGELIEIPQVPITFKYIAMEYSHFAGFPPPLTNGGMNEHQVAARDVAIWSRPELTIMTPNPQRGPNYSDLSRLVLERATTAREAAELVGELIDTHGFSTYGGNSHLFADPNEGWLLMNFAGGQGLWIAERLGADDIRLIWRGMTGVGYIREIPFDFQNSPDHLGSDNFVSFAVDQGWYVPASGDPFDVVEVYCRGGDGSEAIDVDTKLRELAPHVTPKHAIEIVRKSSRDSSGYGTVAHLRENVREELGVIWIAPAPSLTAPFVPYHLGVLDAPPEFKRHRYLTDGESRQSIDPAVRGLESTRYANRECKRLLYLTLEHRDEFLPEVTGALEAFENQLFDEQATVEQSALTLFDADEADLAREYLTYYSSTEAMNGLRLVQALADGIEARTKARYGIRQPGDEIR